MPDKTYNLLIPATKAVDNGDGTYSISVSNKIGDDGLQSIQLEHRGGRSLNDFFVSRGALTSFTDLDTWWTNTLRVPTGGGSIAIYSRKAFSYPMLGFRMILPGIAANADLWVGFERGGAAPITGIPLIALLDANTGTYFNGFEASPHIEDILPANAYTALNRYTLKVNKCSAELFVDYDLIAVLLAGVPEALPVWENNPPYALASGKAILPKSLPTLLETHTETQISSEGNSFIAADGDPLPPRQYALYNENTATKWTGLATAGALQTSHPVPVWGYTNKSLYFMADGAGTLTVQIYSGGGWRTIATPAVAANTLVVYALASETPIARCTYDPSNNDTITLAEWCLS